VNRLESEEIRFDAPAGETGTLFSSVTATDIAEKVWTERRVRIDRRKIELPESIKRIGRYQVPVELFPDVSATLRLAIVPEGGELPPEEELEALAAAEAEAEAEAQAQSEAEHEQAEAEIQALVEEDEGEAEEEIRGETETPPPADEAPADEAPAEAEAEPAEPEPEPAEPEPRPEP
jgi:hypothetical protein